MESLHESPTMRWWSFALLTFFRIIIISKKLEHTYNTIEYDTSSISAVNPRQYLRRFRDFIFKLFTDDNWQRVHIVFVLFRFLVSQERRMQMIYILYILARAQQLVSIVCLFQSKDLSDFESNIVINFVISWKPYKWIIPSLEILVWGAKLVVDEMYNK